MYNYPNGPIRKGSPLLYTLNPIRARPIGSAHVFPSRNNSDSGGEKGDKTFAFRTMTARWIEMIHIENLGESEGNTTPSSTTGLGNGREYAHKIGMGRGDHV